MLLVLLLSLLACSVPCESAAAGPTRDTCLHQRVTLDTQRWTADEVVRFAGAISDPIVREATVMVWVRDHRGRLAADERDRVCGLLAGLQRQTCARRLDAAHLTR